MTRITIKTDDGLCWFDDERATSYVEATTWNGNNHISIATGSQWDHEMLYRTTKGRWVLHRYSNQQGSTPTYEFVDSDEASEWLILNEHDKAATEHFEIEDERGPGRPEIGGRVNVRLGELLSRVKTYAEAHSTTEAQAVRQLVEVSLDAAEFRDGRTVNSFDFALSKDNADDTTDSISIGRVGGKVSMFMSRVADDGFHIAGPAMDLSQEDCIRLASALLRFWIRAE